MLMLGFYILLRVFGIPVWLAGLGGIMWAFSSYFFILISAGHIWKFITLAYVPPTIAGIVLAYRGKLLWGGILTALFVALQITSNHVQMSYYFFFVILFFVGAYFEKAWRTKTLPQFFKASAVLIVAALVGIAANVSNLYHTYAYSKETMRGKSELVQTGDAAKQTSSGLDRDYITQWSYGIDETLTLLVPNFKGGASAALSQSETAMSKANPMYSSLYGSLTQYFGTQPMTSGPVYVGAFVLFLFVLGCFIVKGTVEVGIDRSHLLLHRLVLGQELHAADGFLHRLRPVVQQVPRRVLHPCHSRVHDTFAGYLCPETPARRAGNLKTRKEAPRHQPAAHCRHRPAACRCPGQHRLRLRARPRGTDAAECRQPADDTRQRTLRHPCQLGRDACRTRQQRRPA